MNLSIFLQKNLKRLFLVVNLVNYFYLNNSLVNSTSSQKNRRMLLDVKLDFPIHQQNACNKVYETIVLLLKQLKTLHIHIYTSHRVSLITTYKSLIRPYLDYGNIIYDVECNTPQHQKLESVKCNASLTITSAKIKETKNEKLLEVRS